MSLAQAASTQYQVVGALLLREARAKFGQSQLGYMWALVEPTLWILTFYVAFLIGHKSLPPGMDYMAFLVTGIGTYQLFQKVADPLMGSVGGNKSLLVFPHVVPMDVFVAKSILNFSTVVVVNCILIGINCIVTGAVPDWQSPLAILYGGSAAGICGFGLGLIFGAISNYTMVINRVKIVLMRPLFWTSGLFFAANDLPTSVRDILLYNPILNATEIVRGGWFPQYDARHASASYLGAWAVGLLLVGLAAERASRAATES